LICLCIPELIRHLQLYPTNFNAKSQKNLISSTTSASCYTLISSPWTMLIKNQKQFLDSNALLPKIRPLRLSPHVFLSSSPPLQNSTFLFSVLGFLYKPLSSLTFFAVISLITHQCGAIPLHHSRRLLPILPIPYSKRATLPMHSMHDQY
jgi:hypothetical protein